MESQNLPRTWVIESRRFEPRSLREEVEAAIARLPETRRRVFILSRFHGLTFQEIAETMGISVRTVSNEMSRAIADLEEALSRYLGEDE